MRTIRPSRRVKTLKIWPSGSSAGPMLGPRAPSTTDLAAAGELERVDLAARLHPPTERVDHLLRAVTNPLLAQPLPADVRIEQPRRRLEITAPDGAEEVDHDRLEILLADAWHCSSFASNRSSPADSKPRKEAYGHRRRGDREQAFASTAACGSAQRPGTRTCSSVNLARPKSTPTYTVRSGSRHERSATLASSRRSSSRR